MRNKQIELDGVIIPYIINDEGVEYYPVKYVFEQFLTKGLPQLHKKDKFKEYISRYIIDYSFKGTTPQETNCMNKDGWIKYLETCNKNQNKNELKERRLKMLCDYMGAIFNDTTSDYYSSYALECLNDFKILNPVFENKRCVSCGRELPDHKNFFARDMRTVGKMLNTCRECNKGYFQVDDKSKRYVYDNFGLSMFEEFIKNKDEFIISYAIDNKGKELDVSKIYKDNDKQIELVLKMAEILFDKGLVSISDLSVENIKPLLNIKDKTINKLKNNKLIEYFVDDIRLRPWKCKNYILGVVEIDEAINIFKTYLKDYDVKIENIFEYNEWFEIVKRARIRRSVGNDLLSFVVRLYNKEYAGYLFNIASVNYYKNKENLIFDMKYLVEKDLCIPIEKIPLYVTKYSLSQKSRTLYELLRKENRIFKDLYEWIDACYPNKFIRTDFDLNPYRSRFDSLEEAQVYEEITKITKGVIYNPRNDENRIEIMGMIPDFIIHTNKGCYLTEYFGLYAKKFDTSERLKNYMRKHEIKINKYKELETLGYKSLFIYPDDLKNDFEGLREKVKYII